ncbi:MAG: amidase [Acidobacteria bacterium]|nr:amidase [Acidobacteriota bacterium]MBI3658277.1 amidase [Acidobacteriota bacterium]
MASEDLLFSSIRELATQLRARKISPVELTKAYLNRLERYGPKLGAVVTITRELALAQAQTAESEIMRGNYRGLLHGIPYGAKDLLATRGIPTTWGAAPYRDQVFDFDATVIERLRRAGAVLVAKLAMVELAGGMGYNNPHASFTGPGRSPWNTDYWSGGSSSGPGAATAAGLVGFAIGSETSGSILTPAAFCGVTGLRPTYGLVSRYGAMALSWTLDKIGPMCRSVDDCGLVLAVISGRDPKDPSTAERIFTYKGGENLPRKFKIGVLKGATNQVQPEVKTNFEAALEVLGRLGTLTPDVELPDFPYGPVVGVIVGAEGASAFLDLIESGRVQQLQAPRDRIGGYSNSMIFAVDYLQAMRIRGLMKQPMHALLSQYDAVVAPTRATVAYPIGMDFEKAYPGLGGSVAVIPAGNLVGAPAISVPNGFGPNNLPTGLQFLGRPFGEGALVAIANAYQRQTEWHRRHPSL